MPHIQMLYAKMKSNVAYSFDEANEFGGGFPDRGIKCEKCRTLVPQLEKFGIEEQVKWREILSTKGWEDADEYLISMTGCNHRWAKIWRLHPNGASETRFSGPPCPNCEEPLPNERSKQCLACGENWHA